MALFHQIVVCFWRVRIELIFRVRVSETTISLLKTKRRSFVSGRVLKLLDANFGQDYSQERYTAFQSYQETASLLSIALSCLCIALCPLLFVICIDVLPIDAIDKGLTGKNWFSVATYVLGGIYCSSASYFRYKYLVPQSTLSFKHHVIAGSTLPIMVFLAYIAIGTTLIFPVPFGAIVTSSVGLPCMLFTYAWLERENLLKFKSEFISLLATLGIAFTFLGCHQVVGVLYTSVHGNQWAQSAVALMLPVLKFAFRVLYGWYFKDKAEGYATGLMTFEVELFNTLYTSIFMQSATNPIVMMTLMSVDVFENCSFLYRMNKLGKQLSQIKREDEAKTKILRKVLFRTEFVALIEFIEVLTPLLYSAHLLLLRHAPNLQYFSGFASLSDTEFYESMENLFVLVSFELVSLVALIATLKYRYDLPLIYQIGFFVDKHRGLIISTTCLWFGIALIDPRSHSGNDYSFEFAPPRFKILI